MAKTQPGGMFDLIINDEFSEDDLNAFSDGDASISDDIAHRADHAWNYEAMFERKTDLIKTVVTYLKFDVDPDHQRYGRDEFAFEGESLEDKIATEVNRDKARRLQRDNF